MSIDLSAPAEHQNNPTWVGLVFVDSGSAGAVEAESAPNELVNLDVVSEEVLVLLLLTISGERKKGSIFSCEAAAGQGSIRAGRVGQYGFADEGSYAKSCHRDESVSPSHCRLKV